MFSTVSMKEKTNQPTKKKKKKAKEINRER
jgi:hypothetical protein